MTGAKLQEGQADLPSTESTCSYWHREPSEALLGYRSAENLPPTADVVVVGSGITGAFAAKELLEGPDGAAKTVALLEAREVCWGATGRNGGHCQPVLYGHTSTPPPAVNIADFELRTYTYLQDLVAKHDIPCDWVSLRGVHALLTPDLVSHAATAVSQVPSHLKNAVRLVTDPEELKALRVPHALGAVVQENAASCWPYKLVAWVFEDLIKRFGTAEKRSRNGGGWFNLQTNTPVTRLQRLDGDDDDDDDDETHKWIVHTDRGQIAARQVLLASNGYTSRLLPSFSDLIVPVRGQVAALAPEPRVALGRSYVFMASSAGTKPNQDDYLIQRPTPGLEMILGGGRANGTARGVGISDDDEVDPVVATYLRRAGARNVDLKGEDGASLAEKEELRASYEWTGIMGFSRDGRPWVGEVPGGEVLGGGKGLWVCAGYTGHGMPQAALCGTAVAGMMAGSDHAVEVPREFLVGETRAREAKERPTIKEMDDLDMFLL